MCFLLKNFLFCFLGVYYCFTLKDDNYHPQMPSLDRLYLVVVLLLLFHVLGVVV
eukprot:UN04213